MKPISFIHFADGHFSRENQDRFGESIDEIYHYAQDTQPDFFVFAGDLFDRAIHNSKSSGFPDLVAYMNLLMDIAPVYAVTGTPTHDVEGCYEIFRDIGHFRLITTPEDQYKTEDCMIFGFPEISKQYFLRNKMVGKEEANELITQGIKEILLRLGAIRKENPDIPCVFIYHGVVKGASISDTQVMPAGGIQLGQEDLALVDADYYALGHIHKGQQIGNTPAFYSGSMFPVDWGETDQKAFNYVKLSDQGCRFERIPYPHRPRKKIVVNEPWDIPLSEIAGLDTWIQLRAKKEQVINIDCNAIFQGLIEAGAGDESRVEIVTIPTETVRAGEITDALTIKDKLLMYGDLSGEKIQESIFAKAGELTSAIETTDHTVGGLNIELQKLVLRGAIGIQKGQGKDQIEIDFSDYDDGLIALVGVNGAGKTTLIENMHPFPQMLTRSGKLADHFYLRDSFRDLYFIDKKDGVEYRAFIQIDGVNKAGASEYYLYYDEGENEWLPLPDINGPAILKICIRFAKATERVAGSCRCN
jgi:DNA repair exonuclease SbcCD nuclease subunit